MTNSFFGASLAEAPVALSMRRALYILLINPAFTTINMIFDQYGAYSAMDMLQNGLNGKLPNFIVEHWYWCSIAAQLLCTFSFVKLAAHFLNPLRVKKSKKRGKK